jgi:hypothetical protein
MHRIGRFPLGSAIVVSLILSGCAENGPVAANLAGPELARSADRCVLVNAEIDAVLGPWFLNGEMMIGAAPMPITLGGVSGWMASAVTEQSPIGKSGTQRLRLVHVFSTTAPTSGVPFPTMNLGDDWFMTEDKAVCAAGSVAGTCLINDQMRIVDGAGRFENAEGMLQNHGRINFVTGTLTSTLSGRICGDDL